MRFVIVLLVLLGQLTLKAQPVSGSISGTVSDAAGKPVAGATVTITRQATGISRSTATSATGEFLIPLVQPGEWRVAVARDGFREHSQTLPVEVNQEIRLEVQLLPGARSEQVTVTATPALLKTESAALSSVIDNRQILSLPLDGRNFYELTLLAPGVLPSAQGSASSVRGDFAVSVNGAREDANNFTLDGVYNVDPKLNGVSHTPPVDAIREFEIATSMYDASFARSGGGQVTVVTRSGGNQVHGAAYEFFRNGALDARNFFAPADEASPKYQRNQFGFVIGGPVVRNRTFFFADYEGRRLNEGITRITNVPTALERNGDFSRSQVPAVNPFTGQLFPGNRIPVEFQNPVGRAIANLWPLPNRNVAGANFVSSPTLRDRNNQFDARIDHNFSAASQLAARYSLADRELYEPFSGPTFSTVPGYGADVARRAQNAMISETHTLTPSLLNELRLGFNRVAIGVTQEGQGTSVNRQVGLPELATNPRDFGLSFTTVVGYAPLGHEFNNPQASTTNTFQIADNLTWNRGRHLAKFGFDIRHTRQYAFRDIQARGFLNFIGITGNPLAELLLGIVSFSGGATVDNPQRLRTTSYNFYGNDQWRITPTFTLNYGLRWEYNSPPVDALDRANLYDPATGRLTPVGTGAMPRGGYESDRNNIAPRVGFAWNLRNKYVVRGGYGIYFDQSPLAPGEGLYFSPPYFNLRFYFPLSAQAPLLINNPWPASFPLPTPPSALAFQRDLETGYIQQWNFSIQRQLWSSATFEAGYVGAKGTHLIAARDINQPQPSNTPRYQRPNPAFEDINIIESRANSNYHSLQARFQQRFSRNLTALASYTFGKSIDNASGFFSSAGDSNFPQNSYNLAAERGRSNFDVRQRFTASYTWDLPFGRGQRWANSGGFWGAVAGGWQSAGVLTFQSGRPFTVALLSDIDQSNTGRTSLGFGNNDRPNRLSDGSLDNPSPDRWFNTGAFAPSPRGTFGNSGRNILDGPGLANINFSMLRNVSLRERATLQFRFEFFNLLNRANFDQPDNFVGSPSFGRILSAQAPRRVQLGVKLLF